MHTWDYCMFLSLMVVGFAYAYSKPSYYTSNELTSFA
jgi:hypothetical protein